MKKLALFAVAMFVCAAAFAQVKVSQNGTVTTYEKGATINVDGTNPTEVVYGGVSISIPKGKRVVISQNKAGNIVISGFNLAGIKVMGQEVRADDYSIYVVNPETKTIVRTPLAQTAATTAATAQQNANNRNNANNAAAKKQEAAKQTINIEVAFPEVDDFINEIASQQAIENVEEQLSPSAPRA